MTKALGDASLAVQLAATRSLPDWRDLLPPTAERQRDTLARTLEPNLEIDAPAELRVATLDAIEALHLTETQEPLMFMVTDLREDQDVQLRAVRTLGAIGKLSAFPALMQVLNRGGVYRVEAQAAIDRLATPKQPGGAIGAPDGDKVGLGDLPAAIRGFEKDVAGNRAREMEALEGLGMAPSPTRQADSLRQALEQGTPTQRLNAVYQISQRRIPGAEKLLLGSISDIDSSVAQAAATALASIAGKSCRDELEGVLKTGGARARAAAAMGLAELALPESLDPLIVALGNETDAAAAVEIMKALAALGDKRAAPHIIEKLSSADPRVSRTAHSALTRLAGQDLGDTADRWRAWAAAG
ncbi:MAG: HEAT repeat domain-containing protein [Deltaproteobacteria bacterium]|nr:HEAT repeat domain-containing protein [Deltaproteobacteria bacterium]